MGYGKKKTPTGGMTGVGNTEFRHDGPFKPRNPLTRGGGGTSTGAGSRNRQTPNNPHVQDGKSKYQRALVERIRSKGGNKPLSRKAFKGGGHNPYGGCY